MIALATHKLTLRIDSKKQAMSPGNWLVNRFSKIAMVAIVQPSDFNDLGKEQNDYLHDQGCARHDDQFINRGIKQRNAHDNWQANVNANKHLERQVG